MKVKIEFWSAARETASFTWEGNAKDLSVLKGAGRGWLIAQKDKTGKLSSIGPVRFSDRLSLCKVIHEAQHILKIQTLNVMTLVKYEVATRVVIRPMPSLVPKSSEAPTSGVD